ncbi:MAG: hypothetical protein JWN86_1340 [Planctomycetota bacterium]|nr:hypothetical protein [Planctomycetota bacterium]
MTVDESIVRTLSDRVDRLDRENRRLKRFGLLAVIAIIGVVATGGAKLEDRELILRDPNTNKVRVSIGTNADTGSAGLQIFDRQGRKRIALATRAKDDAPVLIFTDENGNEKVQ